jgi:hypothetical protein
LGEGDIEALVLERLDLNPVDVLEHGTEHRLRDVADETEAIGFFKKLGEWKVSVDDERGRLRPENCVDLAQWIPSLQREQIG